MHANGYQIADSSTVPNTASNAKDQRERLGTSQIKRKF